jgi:putative DNA primase/helicase
MTAPHPDTLAAALAYYDAGCSVIAVRTDGSKHPVGTWKQYTQERASRADVERWFANGHPGVGIICGAVSGNLQMIELEGVAVQEGMLGQLREMALGSGLAELWRRVTLDGFMESSPRGGIHILYRIDGTVPGNLKLARRPTDDGLEVLAETRGEGGFVVVAPSHGAVHPNGRPWVQTCGAPSTIPTLHPDEDEALRILFGTLDQMPVAPPAPVPTFDQPASPSTSGGVSPGDDYNAKATWDEILKPLGWTHVHTSGQERFWCRPGKRPTEGHSATTGHGDPEKDWLYVFSSSVPDLPTEETISKFHFYALIHHGGDHKAAASALRAKGYGTPLPPLTSITSTAPNAPATSTAPETSPVAVLTSDRDAGLTDVGNSDLLVSRHQHEFRYVPERGQWLRWGGTHWSWDDASRIIEAAKDTILAIDADGNETIAKHRARSLSRRSLEAMVALARSHPEVVAPAALLDADPYALCTPSGVVDLRVGTIHDGRPADLHTRSTSVPFTPMSTPRWDTFLADTFGDDTELLGFVQRLAGYSTTGAVTHHVLPFLHGSGGNGKSVFLDVLRRVLGDYAATAPAGFLLSGQTQHETEVARLAGLRFVICSEVNQEARFDEAKVKLLTGGDALTARFMRADHFTFTPTHHLWLMGNHQPGIGAGGESFARRLRLIPFTRTVADDKKVEGLDQQLVDAEGPGILAWLVQGALLALSDGLRAPAGVLAATKVYMDEEDALARFVEDRLLLGGGSTVKGNTADVRRAYTTWCSEQGEKAVSPQVFGREMRTRYGVEQGRSHGARYYLGVTVLKDENEPETSAWNDR